MNDEHRPIIDDNPLYQLLREGKVKEFNERIAAGESADFVGHDFRGLDLKCIEAKGLNLADCYFRQADLRGVDLSETNMEGASINGSKISGTLFPAQLSAEEITLSLLHGTRMRYTKP